MNFTLDQIRDAVIASLQDEDRLPRYRGLPNLAGHCYVASEAFYHLVRLVGDRSYIVDFRHMIWEGESHWYCIAVNKQNWQLTVFDLTATQFKSLPDYARGRVVSFLTTLPSKRAEKVIVRATAILENSALTSDSISAYNPGEGK